MILRAVLWDMDGVLIDTTAAHFESWRTVVAECGIQLDRQTFLGLLGRNNIDTVQILMKRPITPREAETIGKKKEELFREMLRGNAKLLPGVLDWLACFRSRGYAQAVATSAPWENIDALMESTGIRPYFQAIVSAYELPGKPDPYVFQEAARQVGIPPAECLVIEDSKAGIEAAKRGGFHCLAVETTHPIEKLQQADWVLHRLSSQDPVDFIAQIGK